MAKRSLSSQAARFCTSGHDRVHIKYDRFNSNLGSLGNGLPPCVIKTTELFSTTFVLHEMDDGSADDETRLYSNADLILRRWLYTIRISLYE
jgi:hypothetical protein